MILRLIARPLARLLWLVLAEFFRAGLSGEVRAQGNGLKARFWLSAGGRPLLEWDAELRNLPLAEGAVIRRPAAPSGCALSQPIQIRIAPAARTRTK